MEINGGKWRDWSGQNANEDTKRVEVKERKKSRA